MRRFFDLGVLLIFFSNFNIIFIYFCILFFISGNPNFFSQDRGGFQNKKIKIYKFRSMKKVNNNNIVTNWGFILRTFKLDEIPQFYNILRGDLSLIGPSLFIMNIKIYTTNNRKKISC